ICNVTASDLHSTSSHFLSTPRHHTHSTPFPYTTLFRSRILLNSVSRSSSSSGSTSSPRLYTVAIVPTNTSLAAKEEISPIPIFQSEEHTSELQSREKLVCRLLLVKKKPMMTHTQPIL